jgi:hypothetical protein
MSGCENSTSEIQSLFLAHQKLDHQLNTLDIVGARYTKEDLERLLAETYARCDKMFIEVLQTDKFWQVFTDNFPSLRTGFSAPQICFYNIANHYRNLANRFRATPFTFRNFVDSLATNKAIHDFAKKAERKIEKLRKTHDTDNIFDQDDSDNQHGPQDTFEDIYTTATSLFLEIFMNNKKLTLQSSDFNYGIEKDFGAYFHRGEIVCESLGHHAFYHMAGGKATILHGSTVTPFALMSGGEAVHQGIALHPCEGMGGGNATFCEASGNIGQMMTGGTILVENYKDGMPGYMAKGGTIIIENIDEGSELTSTPGLEITLLSLDKKKPKNVTNGNNRFYFDINHEDWCMTNPPFGKGEILSVNHKGIKSTALEKLKGMFILSTKKLPESWPMREGIVVLNGIGDNTNIGKDMRGGAIIIDDENLSLEEVKSRVCHEKTGGMIFYFEKLREEKPRLFLSGKLKDYKLHRLA